MHGGREVLVGDAARQYRAALRAGVAVIQGTDRLADEWFTLMLKVGTLSDSEAQRMGEVERLIAENLRW